MSRSKPAEVTSARIRLDATLQHLVDKKEEDVEVEESEGTLLTQTDCFSKPTPSPKKSTSKVSRKRKRRADSTDDDNADGQQTVIMKLFERSVDLAQFPEDTPLYPVCRAWLHNRPHDKTLGTLTERPASPKAEEDASATHISSDNMPNVYEMPPPIKSEDGCLYDLRVPEPVPQPPGKLDIYADPATLPAPEQLLLGHLTRWKEIRNKWREASIMNEMQYASSINLLKDMFDNNMDAI
ncbi:protein lin-37 homolog [Elysia marginata]|uniref:Protein lin-37 homolog n=1 Tax=Elysia marginata TaxID=1093978 RepID=A0AAV4FPG7_9GAST|nr:protein lin-37 homolog [Elysia marginata]